MSAFVTIDIETTGKNPLKDRLLCVGIGSRVYPPEEGLRMARQLMVRPGMTLAAHTNFDLRWLMLAGARLGDGVAFHDTKVLSWLLDGTQPLDLESLTTRYCGYTPVKALKQRGGRVMFDRMAGSSLGTEELVPIEETPWDELAAYCLSDLKAEAALYEVLRSEMKKAGQWRHFVVEEAPFSKLLVEIEVAGMPFDREAAVLMQQETDAQLETLERRLCALTSAPGFNVRSGEQVARFLYTEAWTQEIRFPIPRLAGKTKEEKLAIVERVAPPRVMVERIGRDYAYGSVLLDGMGLAPPKRDKKAKTPRPSVSAKKLAILYGDNPWVADYVAFSKLHKLGGYLRDWIERAHDGRLYGRFDQSGTATGRLSAREPNLQQVATDGPVRGLFRGDLVVGDFGGLEARLAAHLSGDAVMLDIFRSGCDLYGVLAAQAWGGPPTKENEGRGLMKVLWLASQYGAHGETLAFTMAVAGMRGYTPQKAEALLHDLERTVPRLFEWRKEVIEEAQANGYVTTIGGRRRQLAGLKSASWEKKAQAERQAVNSTVQGGAADIVRRVMLKARRAVAPSAARMILQAHDEVLWERGPDWHDDIFPVLVDVCQNGHGFALDVPLVFEAQLAESWAEKGGSAGQVVAGAYAHLQELAA